MVVFAVANYVTNSTEVKTDHYLKRKAPAGLLQLEVDTQS